jgi:hypothetical protein
MMTMKDERALAAARRNGGAVGEERASPVLVMGTQAGRRWMLAYHHGERDVGEKDMERRVCFGGGQDNFIVREAVK